MRKLILIFLLFNFSFAQWQEWSYWGGLSDQQYSLDFTDTAPATYCILSGSTAWNPDTNDIAIFVRLLTENDNLQQIIFKQQNSSNTIQLSMLATNQIRLRLLKSGYVTVDCISNIIPGYSLGEFHGYLIYFNNSNISLTDFYVDGDSIGLTSYTGDNNRDWDNTGSVYLTYVTGDDIKISKLALWKDGAISKTNFKSISGILSNNGYDDLDFRVNYSEYNLASKLKAYYEFNEGSGQYVHDLIGTEDFRLGSSIGEDTNDPFWSTIAPQNHLVSADDFNFTGGSVLSSTAFVIDNSTAGGIDYHGGVGLVEQQDTLICLYRSATTHWVDTLHGYLHLKLSADNGNTWIDKGNVLDTVNLDERLPVLLILPDDSIFMALELADSIGTTQRFIRCYKSGNKGRTWVNKGLVTPLRTHEYAITGEPVLFSNNYIGLAFYEYIEDTSKLWFSKSLLTDLQTWDTDLIYSDLGEGSNTYAEPDIIVFNNDIVYGLARTIPATEMTKQFYSINYGETWIVSDLGDTLVADAIDLIKLSTNHILGCAAVYAGGHYLYNSSYLCNELLYPVFQSPNLEISVSYGYVAMVELNNNRIGIAYHYLISENEGQLLYKRISLFPLLKIRNCED